MSVFFSVVLVTPRSFVRTLSRVRLDAPSRLLCRDDGDKVEREVHFRAHLGDVSSPSLTNVASTVATKYTMEGAAPFCTSVLRSRHACGGR